MRLANSKLSLLLDGPPDAIARIETPDGACLCSGGRQHLLIRSPLAVSEPVLLACTRRSNGPGEQAQLFFTDDSGAWHAELRLDAGESGIHFHLEATAPEPIWLIEWRLSGLDLAEVIIPALGGQRLSDAMPLETTLSYKYPFWWNAQFVIGAAHRGGGLWLSSRDESPDLKLLRVGRHADGFAWSYGYEVPAPFAREVAVDWWLDGFAGDWQVPVERHRQWMETAFSLKPLAQKSNFPAWARGINFVLELWGARRDRPEPMHTFGQMAERLQQWAEIHDPAATLVYLPGFAEHGIDSHAPDYHPSPQCGGPAEFGRLVEAAHQLGYHVMIHTNVLAMTYHHSLYADFACHQVIDCFGRPQGWGLDLDGDWLAEPYFAYINPGAKAWGDLMTGVLGELIRTYQVDGVFLDQTLLAFNVSSGPNFVAGMRSHIRRLQQTFPEILFSGEGLHEQVLNPLPMAQIHGIDSISEIHGMDGQTSWRFAHPVSTRLFTPYCLFTAHLLTRHPSHPMFAFQEQAYAELGVIPALCLYDHTQRMDLPEVRAMIERARTFPRRD